MKPIVIKDHRNRFFLSVPEVSADRDIHVSNEFSESFNRIVTDQFNINLDEYPELVESLAKLASKGFIEPVEAQEMVTRYVMFVRNFLDSVNTVETIESYFSKHLSDSSNFSEVTVKSFLKGLLESNSIQENISNAPNKGLVDVLSSQEIFERLVVSNRELLEVLNISDTLYNGFSKSVSDTAIVSEAIGNHLSRATSYDILSNQETLSNTSNKGLVDVLLSQDLVEKGSIKSLSDTPELHEDFQRFVNYLRAVVEDITTVDAVYKTYLKNVNENVEALEILARVVGKGIIDTYSPQEDVNTASFKNLHEGVMSQDLFQSTPNKSVADTLSFQEIFTIFLAQLRDYFEEIGISEITSKGFLKDVNENLSISEAIEFLRNRHLQDDLNNLEDIYLYNVDYFDHSYTNNDYVVKQLIRI